MNSKGNIYFFDKKNEAKGLWYYFSDAQASTQRCFHVVSRLILVCDVE